MARLPGLVAHEPDREDVIAPAKQGAEQCHLLGGCPWNRRIDGERNAQANLRLGTERSQLGLERTDPTTRIRLLDL
jgi:hypothetical protein